MQKKVLLPLMLLLGAGISCDMNATRLPTTGSIGIVLLTPSGARFAAARTDEGATSDLEPIDARASIALTSARLIVTGPTTRTVTSSTAGANGFVLRADGLAPGTYAVAVEGLANGQVAHFGTAAGIAVTAGAETPANVTFPVFQPQIPNATVEDTSDVLRYTVSWNAVQNASSYVVEWSQSPAMTGASSQSVTGATTLEVTVPSEGKWYFTVKAVNPVVTAGGLASVIKPVFLFQGVASVSVTPTGQTVAAGGTRQFAAEGRDADNNIVSGVSWFWASDNHTVARVDQSGLVTAVGAGTANITAVGKGMPGSTAITVTPAPVGAATKLAFVSQPTNGVAAQSLSSIQVAVQAADGQVVTSDDATQVTISIGSNPGSGTLSGTATATANNGIATFANLSINRTGSDYTLSANAASLTGVTSSAFDIAPGAAHHLAFGIQPTSSVAGDALSPAVQVEIRDIADNVVTSSRDPVTIAIAANPGTSTLTGTKVVNAINGIASFTGLWLNKIGNNYTLSATSGSLTNTTSSQFNISPAAAAKLAFSAQPTNTQGNAAMAAVTVTIADQFDNPTTATNSVTLSLATDPWESPFSPGAALSGTLTVAAVSGVATFGGLRIDKPGPEFAMLARSGTLSQATSNAFDVDLTVSSITTGADHSCGITPNGSYCWGYNWAGQLGATTGNTSTDSIAALVRGGLTFVSITSGFYHNCGLTAAGAAYCWGYNGEGALGNNSQTQSDVPVAVVGGHQFASIAAGGTHTCGITTPSGTTTEDRQVYCWGSNGQGQAGDGTVGGTPRYLVPTRVVPTATFQATEFATQISGGANHTCAVTDADTAYCWGYNAFGQLGDGTVLNVSGSGGISTGTPAQVLGGYTFESISAGGTHSCAVTVVHASSKPVVCWGRNAQGQLGDQTNTGSSVPVEVSALLWLSVSAGGSHSCAVLSGGSAYCWGNNGSGQLGDDATQTSINQPVLVNGSLTFSSITSGNSHTCGLATTGAYCWGNNGTGQLGSPGTGQIKRVPTQIIQ